MRIGFIGAGNMARALARAIVAALPGTTIVVSDTSSKQLDRFSREVAVTERAAGNHAVPGSSDVTFLATKPQVIPQVLPDLAEADGLIVSIAAGFRIAKIEEQLPRARVIRVMPNTPGLVGEMAAGYATGSRATADDAALVESLLQCAGVAVRLPEELLDAVTGLSGSGPAFVARLIGAFIDAGTSSGLPKDAARTLTLATFAGTARLLARQDLQIEELIDMVSSKGGTTVAGRAVLEGSDYRDVIARTVDAAVARSKELGQ